VKQLPKVMWFGKYKGVPLKEIAERDPQYLDWVIRTVRDPDGVMAVSEALGEVADDLITAAATVRLTSPTKKQPKPRKKRQRRRRG
jgi:hypothetical protein